MGFDFNEYRSAGNYISASEKKVLAENGIPFAITAIRKVHKFDQENYELTITVPDPSSGAEEERTLSFPIGSGAESRDSALNGLAGHFEGGGDVVKAKLEKIGRAYFLANAG